MKKLTPFSKPKSKFASVMTPSAYLSRCLKIPQEQLHEVAPAKVIICLESGLFKRVRRFCKKPQHRSLPGNLLLLPGRNGPVGVCGGVGVGAPALALLLEDLIVLGVKEFIGIGTAGLLDGQEGDQKRLFVCEKAIRDEGTSRHYIAANSPAAASLALTSKFCFSLAKKDIQVERAISWTTDAPYRETLEELRYYRDIGVQTVDMEASACFSIATSKGVDFALSFAISDVFNKTEWVPYYGSRLLQKNLLRLFIGAADVFNAKIASA